MGRGRTACRQLVFKLRAAQASRSLSDACSVKLLFSSTYYSFDWSLLSTAHRFHNSRFHGFRGMHNIATHAETNIGALPVYETGAENGCASLCTKKKIDELTMCKVTPSAVGDGFLDDALDENRCHAQETAAAEEEESEDTTLMPREELPKSERAVSMYRILKDGGWSSPKTEQKLSSVAHSVTPTLVIEVLTLLRNGQVALGFLNWAKDQEGYEPQAEAFTHLIARFGRERDFNSAWCVLVEMKRDNLAVDYAFSIFIHRLKRAKKAQGLVKAMSGMTYLGVTPTVALYTSAIEFLLKLDSGEGATKLYKQMLEGGIVPDKKLYELMITGYGKVGKVEESVLLFEEMQHKGYVPHVSVYSALISAFSVAKKLDKGKELYMEMIRHGSLPRVFEVNEIACALHGRDTMEMIDRFLKVVDRTAFRWRIHSHNNLLQCLFESGRYAEGMEVFGTIPYGQKVRAPPHKDPAKCYWNLESFRICIFGLCKLAQFGHALEMFEELLQRDLKPTSDISSFILLSLSNVGRIEQALSFCKHITGRSETVSSDAQHCFFTSLRTSGNLSVALKVFASMRRKGCIDQDSDFVSLIGLESEDEVVVSLTA